MARNKDEDDAKREKIARELEERMKADEEATARLWKAIMEAGDE